MICRYQLFKKIMKEKLKLPKSLSSNAQKLIASLMERNVKKRLGSGSLGVKAIKMHPWFSDIDWKAVERRELKLPAPILKQIPKRSIGYEIFGRLDRGTEVVEGWEYTRESAR